VPVSAAAAEVDVSFHLGTGDMPLPRAPEGHHVVDYSSRDGSARFVVDPGGVRICADWSRETPVKRTRDLTALLLGPILGSVLRLRGTVSLHACVVNVASQAIAVMAAAGTGKSTLAATMARHGHAILSDDVAALVEDEPGRWLAQPGYPRLRLAPETLGALGLDADDCERVQSSLPKRYLELSDDPETAPWRFQSDPLRLGAVYVLERDSDVTIPTVEPLDGPSRVAALLRHVRVSPFRLDRAARAAELDRLARLASDVAVRRLRCPGSLDALPATRDALLRDVEQPHRSG
jgi:hypothetical protein